MKSRNLYIAATAALAAGLALIVAHSAISAAGVVIAGGSLFILAGLLSIYLFMGRRQKSTAPGDSFSSIFICISGIAALVSGLSMIIFNDTFSPLMAFIPGILAAIAALYQFYLIGFGCRPVPMPVWLFAAPLALTGLSIYIFMQYDTPLPDSTNILLTAISLLVFGAATMIEAIVTTRHNRPAASRPTADSPVGLNDATH